LLLAASLPAAAPPAGPEEPPLTLAQYRTPLAGDLHEADSRRLLEAGKKAEAACAAERAVDLEREVLGGAHPRLVDSLVYLGYLAGLHRLNGEFAQAEALYRKLIELRREGSAVASRVGLRGAHR
jgi:hypothetical protein